MILTTEVREALERYRNAEYSDDQLMQLDRARMCDAFRTLFPPGYHDTITPERLELFGFCMKNEIATIPRQDDWIGDLDLYYHIRTGEWRLPSRKFIPKELRPRNMGEVLELVQRCKEGM